MLTLGAHGHALCFSFSEAELALLGLTGCQGETLVGHLVLSPPPPPTLLSLWHMDITSGCTTLKLQGFLGPGPSFQWFLLDVVVTRSSWLCTPSSLQGCLSPELGSKSCSPGKATGFLQGMQTGP